MHAYCRVKKSQYAACRVLILYTGSREEESQYAGRECVRLVKTRVNQFMFRLLSGIGRESACKQSVCETSEDKNQTESEKWG